MRRMGISTSLDTNGLEDTVFSFPFVSNEVEIPYRFGTDGSATSFIFVAIKLNKVH